MKTILLVCTLLSFSLVSIYAQDDSAKIGGIRAGFHSASLVLDGEKPDTANSLNNFYIGFFREKKVVPLLYWGTGIEYFQNGIKYSTNTKRVMHTISVPVHLKLKLGPVFGLAGAAANFKVAERIVIGDNGTKPIDSNLSNWFDIPVFLGAGVKILFLSVEARYYWGLLDIQKGYYNRYLQIGAAMSF